MPHMIELRKVSKFYTSKETVSTGFSRIDLKLDMGEFVAITGESGSGKSTLLNVISGLDTYEEGEMFVNGEDTSAYRTQDYERYRKTYIGNIFQDYNLINSYTVYQNIELSMMLCGRKRKERKARVMELLELVDMTGYKRTKASRLSGGQKQRVAIARALAKDAPIIVADEPTGNLDSASALKVMETLHRISKDRLVVIVTHNYEQAEPYVTRKITMHDGRIIEDKRISRESGMEMPAEEDAAERYDAMMEAREAEWRSEAEPEDLYADPAETAALETSPQQFARKGGRAERNAAKNAQDAGRAASAAKPAAPAAEPVRRSEAPKRSALAASGGRTAEKTATSASGTYRAPKMGDITALSQLRLGLRNTFNLPAKFILLLIVYLFITAAVLSQYASTKLSLHQNELMGYNQYFQNLDPARIILTKEDRSAFTEEDLAVISGLDNVRTVVKADLGLDISGPTYPISTLERDVDLGRMPETDTEAVILVDEMSYAWDTLQEMGEEILGKKYYLDAMDSSCIEWGDRLVNQKIEIVGVIFDADTERVNDYGYTYIYISDEYARKIMVKTVAASSTVTIGINGIRDDVSGRQILYPSKEVPEGQVYIFEEQAYQYYEQGNARGKTMTATVNNRYFTDEMDFTIGAVIKPSTLSYWLGDSFKKDDYDTYSSRMYISSEDYRSLFSKGNFQVSVFMEDEKLSETTAAELQAAGYKTLVLKDSMMGSNDGYEFIINMLSVIMLFVEFVVLFFIAYAVIRLIMRSRNTYYSTLRILGANKSNTDNILRIELLTMMLISYGLVTGLAVLIRKGIVQQYVTYISDYSSITERLDFLTVTDFAALFLAMFVMSLLIAKRYSRTIFGDSAMNVYREEV